jgi:hypothetical protein
MEEHVGGVRPVGQISDRIDDEDVRVRVGCQRLLEISTLAGVREVLDEFRRSGEESLEAVLDGAVANGTARWVFPLPVLPCRINDRPSVTKSSPR